MDEALKAQIKAFAMGRVGLGVIAVLAPGLLLRGAVGKDHMGPAPRMLARMLGARDLALGLGVIFAVNRETPVRGWLEAGTVADTGDLVATVLAFRHLPRLGAVGAALSALGGAACGRYLASAIPGTAQPGPTPSDAPAVP